MAQAADRQVARVERALKREDNNKAPEAIVTEALREHDLKDSGRGPLHLAAQQGHAAVVKLLIAGGANIFRLDFAGNTPLMLAMRNGHDEVIGLLQKAEGSRANRKLKQKALQS